MFFSNFLGVFNDNLLKNAIIFIAVGWRLPAWLNYSQLISVVSASLVLPYLLFSPLGGKLAVRYQKTAVFRFFKLIEVPIMLIAVVSFYFEWVYLAVFSVFLMGTQSSLYSPSKYGLIRDIGGEKGVSEGSGGFEAMAFLGILTGTFVASLLADMESYTYIYVLFPGIAVLGYWVTCRIKATEDKVDDELTHKLNPVSFFRHSFRIAASYRGVNLAVFGASVFWLIGSLLQMNLVIHARQYYGVSATYTGVVMGIAAIGIALGTWMAGRVSGEKAEQGLILPGLSGMLIVLLIVLLVPLHFYVFAGLVFVFAFFGGVFQVPNLAVIQGAGLGRNIGTVIAYLNLLTFILILFGSVIFSVTTGLTGQNSFAVFGVLAAICLFCVVLYVARSEFLEKAIRLLAGLWSRGAKIK